MFFTLALSGVGCGGSTTLPAGDTGVGRDDPLEGTWMANLSSDGLAFVEVITLSPGGTSTVTVSIPSAGCTGAVVVSERAWSSTADTLTSSGGTCSGSATCPSGFKIACTASMTSGETCDYALSADDSSLTLTCEGVVATFHAPGVTPPLLAAGGVVDGAPVAAWALSEIRRLGHPVERLDTIQAVGPARRREPPPARSVCAAPAPETPLWPAC